MEKDIAKNFIGVIPPIAFETLEYPKQLLLMFDQLAIDLSNNLSDYENRIITNSRGEIDYLADEGLVTTLSGMIANADPEFGKGNVTTTGSFLFPKNIEGLFNKFSTSTIKAYNGLNDLRTIASRLRELKGVDAVAVGLPTTPIENDKTADRDTVIKITLKAFPMPAEDCSWEALLDFKKSKSSKEQFARLKMWLNKITKQGLKAYEVTDELHSMMLSYTKQMEESNIEVRHGTIEAILTMPLEIIENVIRLKFSDAAKAIFAVKKQNMNLLKEERKLTGREIAYIVNAKKQFE